MSGGKQTKLIREGEFYLAIQLLEHACKLDPRPRELVKLSQLLLRNPLWTNRALGCMRRAIEIDPDFIDAWLELALFWRRRRNSERERKALEKALGADPEVRPRSKTMAAWELPVSAYRSWCSASRWTHSLARSISMVMVVSTGVTI